MFRIDFVTLFAAFGAFQGLTFAVILWLRKGSSLSNRLFSLLLVATSIRIAKNIVVHARYLDPEFSMNYDTWWLLVFVGLSHQFAIGPLYVLYFKSRIDPRFSIPKAWYLHFLPYLLLLLTSPWQAWSFWGSFALHASYVSILCYYLWAVALYRRAIPAQLDSDKGGLRWLKHLLIITGILLLSYSPALFKYMGYIGGAGLYAIGLYVISALLLSRNGFFNYFQKKYTGASVSADKSRELLTSIEKSFSEEKIYLDPELSLTKMARELDLSSNLLSQIINTNFAKSFSDYVNEHRVKHAQELLQDQRRKEEKIATIAFESGFNSLSRFNAVFKQLTGTTPSQYKRQFQG